MAREALAAPLVLATALAGLGCSIDLPAPPNEGETSDGSGDAPEPPRAGAVPLRRLTRDQLTRTLADLLGAALPADVSITIAAGLPVDDESGGFAANTTAVTETTVEQYEHMAEVVADAVAPRRAELHACLADPIPDEGCAATFVAAFGPRALRRPLLADEHDELVALMGAAATAAEADAAVRRVIAAMLQSPDFLYRIERGAIVDGTDTVRLAGHEIAVRLSYLVWGTMPDAMLFADADAGRLHDPRFRSETLLRMLDDPRARAGLAAMHRQWLEVEVLAHLVKDRNLYPNFADALGPELDDELTHFVDRALRHEAGTLHALLTTNVTIGSLAVASWYGEDVVDDRPTTWFPSATSELTLDPGHRAGVLTLLSVMAAHAKPDRSDPIRRGKVVRERLLCQPLAAPPPDVATPPAAPLPGASVREQLAVHTADPSCATCHDRIDPIGFALEGYDAMGVFRTEDAAGNAIDAAGEIRDSDVLGAIDGGVALAHALASSEQVERCYATQWFRYATGRIDDAGDEALLTALQLGFRDSGGHVPTLLRLLVEDEAFIHRRRE